MNLIAQRAKKRVMVLSPHADDAELGVGGYIAKTINEGGEVMVVLATVGDIKFLHLDREVSMESRMQEFYSSMKFLGVQRSIVLTTGLDSRLNTFPMGEMVAMLDKLQEEFKPDEFLIPMPSAHQDHQYCWDVGIATTRPSPDKHSPSVVAAYEYPLSFWGAGSEMSSFRGGIYIDITGYWGQKVGSLSKYKTQMRGGVSLIGTNGVESLARLRGMESGFEKAELLHSLRIIVK